MIFQIVKKEGNCNYEEWSREEGALVDCGISTNIKSGNNYVCREHLASALADKKTECHDKGGHIITSSDFLLYVDGRGAYHQGEFQE